MDNPGSIIKSLTTISQLKESISLTDITSKIIRTPSSVIALLLVWFYNLLSFYLKMQLTFHKQFADPCFVLKPAFKFLFRN